MESSVNKEGSEWDVLESSILSSQKAKCNRRSRNPMTSFSDGDYHSHPFVVHRMRQRQLCPLLLRVIHLVPKWMSQDEILCKWANNLLWEDVPMGALMTVFQAFFPISIILFPFLTIWQNLGETEWESVILRQSAKTHSCLQLVSILTLSF